MCGSCAGDLTGAADRYNTLFLFQGAFENGGHAVALQVPEHLRQMTVRTALGTDCMSFITRVMDAVQSFITVQYLNQTLHCTLVHKQVLHKDKVMPQVGDSCRMSAF